MPAQNLKRPHDAKKFDKKYLKASQAMAAEQSVTELYNKLQTLDELQESALDGRARRKLYHAKLIALGAKVIFVSFPSAIFL